MTSPTSALLSEKQRYRRAVSNTLKGSAGNLVEWYDVYVYSVFAVYFEKQFFDAKDANAPIYVWAIFAVTFVMRPVGSWFFGRIADRFGRRTALTSSISLMAVCSIGVAVTPTEGVIGVGAAVLLVLFRLLQGLATGGEYGTSATYMSEAAPVGKRGFFSSFQYVTLVGGQFTAQLVLLIMLLTLPQAEMETWGWRLAFALGGVAAVIVFWVRRTMDESLDSALIRDARSGKAPESGSLKELVRNHFGKLVLCFLITMGGTLAFYAYTVNGPKIIQTTFTGSDVITGTLVNLIALTGLMILQPLGGWISDRIGRKPLLVFFGIGSVAYTWVFYTYLPKSANPLVAFAILFGAYVILSGYTSINAIVKSELFPTRIRALGVGLGYAIANSVFGGTAPLLYSAALTAEQVPLFVVYVTVVSAASLLVYIFGIRNRGLNWLDDAEVLRQERTEREAVATEG